MSPRRSQEASGGKRAAPDELLVVGDAEPVRMLVALGFTHNEARVYLAMLQSSDVTAAEVAARAGVARPKVYEALDGLVGGGFCRSAGGRVRRFSAVAPEAALNNWLRHRDLERTELAERDEAHVAMLQRILPRPAPPAAPHVPDFIEAVSGRLPTTQILEDFIARAERSLFEMLQPPFLQPRPRWNVMEIEAIRRGVDVRVVYTPEALQDTRRYAPLADAGGQIRVTDSLPMKLLVRDEEEALISLRDATGAQSVTTARVLHPDLVAPLQHLFTQVWDDARPIEPDQRRGT